MPGEPPRPGPAFYGRIRSWSALLILLLVLVVACAGEQEAAVVRRGPVRPRARAVHIVEPTPTPIPITPTPEPTPVPTPPPPQPTALPEAPPPPPPPPPAYVPPPPAAAHNALSASLMSMINDSRVQSGLSALTPNAALISAAQRYAELHFANGPYLLSHTLDGTPTERAAREGYSGGVGEVLAMGSPSPQQIIDMWMASPPHQSIIMGSQYLDVGVGCAVGPYTDANGNTFETALCVGMIGIPY